MNEQNQQLVDMMEHVWGSISGLCDGLTEAEWKTLTDCPAWSVQDQVSHMSGSENGILGNPDPDHTAADVSHTRSDQGIHNEMIVDYRRSWSGQQVLDEFRQNTGQRMDFLRSKSDDDFAAEMQTPVGPAPMSEFISIRIMDAWVHEQDIRRALAQPGELDGPTAAHALGRILRAMPFVVARRAQAPDGATVVFDVSGPAGRVLPVVVEGNRAREADEAPAEATVHIEMDAETFGCLGCGRWEPDEMLHTGRVQVQGDAALGEAIVRQMNIMP
jgi:uncharacterized protein (TIGR03083 family)